MGLRQVQCLITIMNLLFSSGHLAKEPQDSSHYIPVPATSFNMNEDVLNSTLSKRMLLLKPLTSTHQHDIVTPIPTVPAINPSNPTGSTTPTYNSIPKVANPTPPMITPSTMNPINPYTTPSMGIPSSSSGLSWCIASQSASKTSLQVALDYACGYGGADCSQIQPGGSCFDPDTVQNHASYAFNNYYLKNPIPDRAISRHASASTSILRRRPNRFSKSFNQLSIQHLKQIKNECQVNRSPIKKKKK